jgi:hypothetical protein
MTKHEDINNAGVVKLTVRRSKTNPAGQKHPKKFEIKMNVGASLYITIKLDT